MGHDKRSLSTPPPPHLYQTPPRKQNNQDDDATTTSPGRTPVGYVRLKALENTSSAAQACNDCIWPIPVQLSSSYIMDKNDSRLIATTNPEIVKLRASNWQLRNTESDSTELSCFELGVKRGLVIHSDSNAISLYQEYCSHNRLDSSNDSHIKSYLKTFKDATSRTLFDDNTESNLSHRITSEDINTENRVHHQQYASALKNILSRALAMTGSNNAHMLGMWHGSQDGIYKINGQRYYYVLLHNLTITKNVSEAGKKLPGWIAITYASNEDGVQVSCLHASNSIMFELLTSQVDATADDTGVEYQNLYIPEEALKFAELEEKFKQLFEQAPEGYKGAAQDRLNTCLSLRPKLTQTEPNIEEIQCYNTTLKILEDAIKKQQSINKCKEIESNESLSNVAQEEQEDNNLHDMAYEHLLKHADQANLNGKPYLIQPLLSILDNYYFSIRKNAKSKLVAHCANILKNTQLLLEIECRDEYIPESDSKNIPCILKDWIECLDDKNKCLDKPLQLPDEVVEFANAEKTLRKVLSSENITSKSWLKNHTQAVYNACMEVRPHLNDQSMSPTAKHNARQLAQVMQDTALCAASFGAGLKPVLNSDFNESLIRLSHTATQLRTNKWKKVGAIVLGFVGVISIAIGVASFFHSFGTSVLLMKAGTAALKTALTATKIAGLSAGSAATAGSVGCTTAFFKERATYNRVRTQEKKFVDDATLQFAPAV